MEDFLSHLKKHPQLLKHIRQGLEKEGLRCDMNAISSMSKHPHSLGSKLTHPYITTDYAENLMEFITPVFDSPEEMLHFLRELFHFIYEKLPKEEMLWPWSMPCLLPDDEEDIPVADYGTSNIGKLKSLYRLGLGHRYGKSMQSIAGIHYNFSLTEDFWREWMQMMNETSDLQSFIDQKTFHLIRNYRRYSWLLIYLFGSTPVVHESFLKNKVHNLEKLGHQTYGRPYATSLRMGGLGYTSAAQKEISVCFNSLESYIATLEKARLQPYQAYEKIGIKDKDGNYKQLNTHLLQIDNEFYSTIRPKRRAHSQESALQALHRGGVEYIEVRLLDVDPFSDTGISKETIYFLHIFMLYCLFTESPDISALECIELEENLSVVVNQGRNPEALLKISDKTLTVKEHALDFMNSLPPLVELLDHAYSSNFYFQAFQEQNKKVEDPNKTPSAQIISLIDDKNSIIGVMANFAKQYKEKNLSFPIKKQLEAKWNELSHQSWVDQKRIESLDLLSFDQFLEDYFEKIKINFKV